MKHLLDHCCQIVPKLSLRHLIQIHKHRDKRSLSIGRHQRDDLILDHLHTAVNLLFDPHFRHLVDFLFRRLDSGSLKLLAHLLAELLTAHLHKRSQMGQGNTLSAVLGTCNLRDCLCGNVAGSGKALRRIDHRLADNRTVLKHVLQIDQTAVVHVLRKIIRVMKMDDSFLMRLYDLRWQKESSGDILADLTGHIISLYAVYSRILVGVLLFYFLVIAFQQT